MFGLPMLCNDVVGLSGTIGDAKAGVCIDLSSVEHIVHGLKMLFDDYKTYSDNSLRFYDSADMYALHSDLIKLLCPSDSVPSGKDDKTKCY